MLKSLFKKIKSEKSQSLSHQKQQPKPQHWHAALNSCIEGYQFASLSQETVVKCNVQKIRYSVQPQAPDVHNRILACPLSVFNVLPHAKRKVKEIDLKNNPCPEYISHLKRVLSEELPNFNHLLINVYSPGVGIMPHFDGPMYRPKVVVLSLGGPAIINFQQDYGSQGTISSILLEDQSIHIFEGEAYERCLHGIKELCLDSVFLKIGTNSETSEPFIQNSSVSNFHQTRLCSLLLSNLNIFDHNHAQKAIFGIQQQYGVSLQIMPIFGNDDFNFKIEIGRRERISITIREKHPQK